MSIRRTASAGDKVAVLQRAALQDRRLSFRARGVLAAILSRPMNWRTSSERLARETPKEGRDAIRTALSELTDAGYLVRSRVRGEGGRWEWVWDLSDSPGIGPETRRSQASVQVTPETDYPTTAEPTTAEPSSLQGNETTGSSPDSFSPPALVSPEQPARENTGGKNAIPKGFDGHTRHATHQYAKRWCVRVERERRLPVDAAELLAWCYRLGAGDPWEGHRLVDQATTKELDSADSPVRAVRARLREHVPRRRDDAADWLKDPA